MPIKEVFVKTDVYLTCLSHALSTEKEEVMGLLLGHVDQRFDLSLKVGVSYGQSFIENVIILQRSVRQADRVEISPLQLSAAAQEAEKLSIELGKPIRVLGWYHSHPHITVQPSHVDVSTQANYQAMDPDFIGLIFSVFQQEDNEKFANSSLVCFQAVNVDGVLRSREILLSISPPETAAGMEIKTLAKIPLMLFNEEKEHMEKCLSGDLVSKVQNKAVFTQAMCQLLQCCEMPCVSAVLAYEQSLLNNLHRLQLVKQSLDNLTKC
ncbi:lys-63-specific deubiquitinase BRCC36-like [Daphnia carinata]|uniref:lys-63-specific deubiquitinase BRCC36-like n=1 Tax=Daphnia carinata TaxID=120202 RepID=UPI002580E839|nr:lys-63-specific deubiquitinase BRCC36-like [Daphnia carinata]